ncbi:Dabb family protein [Sinomicrobium weinanense]|uniref:Dabb family protein n=1 Tax=Sinomicrobium weinanense TaxID=2842200 RepID=A0A926JUA6_9FLAO|nr:Dabb family protein [Sinomicrobium weinanense]MBC9797509.1 Dabb family protein [Sinomicrobium weinanense]MBU3122205.1 Dabb family protein [Sinomicrobium weinanense]
MKRRDFVKTATTAIAAGTVVPALAGSATTGNHAPEDNVVNHYVLFWLKKDLTEKQIEEFTGFFEMLRKVPGIRNFYYGKPANSTPRDVVDNSFTYNLMIQFNTLEALEVYGVHPIHMEAIEKYSHFWEKVVVHDSVLHE